MVISQQYGPWAVIAGASEGTGAAFARCLAEQKINSVLIARREEPLREIAEEIRRQYNVDCITVALDLTAPDALERVLAVTDQLEIGLFIANAGADLNGSEFVDAELESWQKLVNLNVLAPLNLCYHFARKMRLRGCGGIILLGTGVSYGGMKSLAVYSGSKSFLLGFGESLWSELRPYGVHVLNMMLGRTDTPAFRHALASKGLPLPPGLADLMDVAKVALERLPYGPVHNWGTTDDQAGFAPTSAIERKARIARLEEAGKAVMNNA